MERQLLIISAMIKRVRSRWGLPVIRQRRHRRYRFRPWLGRAEHEEEGQYTRLIPRLQLDDPMAYQNFILMPPELFQDREQRITAEFQRDRTWMRESRSQVSSHSQTSGHWRQLHHPAVCLQGGQFDHQQVYA